MGGPASEAGRRSASREPGAIVGPPRPTWREIMDRLSPGDPTQRVLFMKAAQAGAPLALDTPVPTPFGWTTMGEIVEGDLLHDATWEHLPGHRACPPVFEDRPCYEVAFRRRRSGSSRMAIIAGPSGTSRTDRPVPLTLTNLRDVEEGCHRGGGGKRRRYAIDCCDPIDMPDQDLILHPYVPRASGLATARRS